MRTRAQVLFAGLRAQPTVPILCCRDAPSHMLLSALVACAAVALRSDSDYVVLTKDGATCPAGTEITSADHCFAAVDAANEAIGKPGTGMVDTVSYSIRPKGCYTISFSESYGYTLGYFNTHVTGSGAGTDTGDNRYVHCLSS